MTATPISDSYLEFTYMLNILRNGSIDKNEIIFDENNELIDPLSLKRIVLGLSSYQKKSDTNVFKNTDSSGALAGKRCYFIELLMSKEQGKAFEIVSKKEKARASAGFRVLRRLVSSFSLEETKYDSFIERTGLIHFSPAFLASFADQSLSCKNDYLIRNCSLKRSIEISSLDLNKRKRSVEKDLKEVQMRNLVFLNNLSCKYVKICQLVLQSKGKVLVYQPFVEFEGVKILKVYLERFGISFIEYTQKTRKNRHLFLQDFNAENNDDGFLIKCCIFSSAGSEGISFRGIRTMIIADIPWSGSSLEQIIGRSIRLNSHAMFPLEERYVDLFFLISSTETGESIDREMLEIISRKEKQKMAITQILEASSIEVLNDSYKVEASESEKPFLFSQKYILENREIKVKIKKKMISVLYSFDKEGRNYSKADLEESSGFLYKNGIYIGRLNVENGTPKYKIVDKGLVYIITL
ncbi:hypothetical protein J6590_105292 [Homalodisca vitripennis]|nr:hypothetical protein J6590_105292 [Homalodisca vitripennis]